MLSHGLYILTVAFCAALVLSNMRKPVAGSHGTLGHDLAIVFLGLCFTVASGVLTLLMRILDEQYADRLSVFRPGLQRVLQSFDAPRPERFKDVRFKARAELDLWLKSHAAR